jgi:hypothetical protein
MRSAVGRGLRKLGRLAANEPERKPGKRRDDGGRRTPASESGFDFADPGNDLAAALATGPGEHRFHIHFGNGHEADRRHAERLAGLPGVVLHGHDTDAHQVARHLRERGTLIEAIFGDATATNRSAFR